MSRDELLLMPLRRFCISEECTLTKHGEPIDHEAILTFFGGVETACGHREQREVGWDVVNLRQPTTVRPRNDSRSHHAEICPFIVTKLGTIQRSQRPQMYVLSVPESLPALPEISLQQRSYTETYCPMNPDLHSLVGSSIPCSLSKCPPPSELVV